MIIMENLANINERCALFLSEEVVPAQGFVRAVPNPTDP